MNDRERELWVNNTEPLYRWRLSSGLPMREFLRQHRQEIDNFIAGVPGSELHRTTRERP